MRRGSVQHRLYVSYGTLPSVNVFVMCLVGRMSYESSWHTFTSPYYLDCHLKISTKGIQKYYTFFHGRASVSGHTLAHLYELWTPQCAIDFLGIASGIARATFPAFQKHIERDTHTDIKLGDCSQ